MKRMMCIFVEGFFLVGLSLTASAQFVDLTRVSTAVMSHNEWATQVTSGRLSNEIASAGIDGRIVIWDATSGKPIREISMPAMILSISSSKDGTALAAGDISGTVSIIDTESGKVKTTFVADKKIVNTLVWSDDGKFLAAGGSDGIVRIWSQSEQKISGEINPAHGNITSLAFANSRLAIGMLDFKGHKAAVEVWDWQNKKLIRSINEGAPTLRGMSVSPDGKYLAVADFVPATLLSILPEEGGVFSASVHALPDSDEVSEVAVWDLASGKRAALVQAETGARSIAFSSDSKLLACAGPNGIILFDVADQTFLEVGRLDSLTSIDSVAFSPDSQQLFLARQREPLARFGSGGLEKLFNPFFVSMTMTVREGANSGVAIETKIKSSNSVTGGSNIEAWKLSRRTAPQDAKLWSAVRAYYDDKPDEGRKILEQLIKDNPSFGEAQRLFAIIFESREIQKIQARLAEAVKSDANCVSCWRSLGDIQYKVEKDADAIKSYEQVLKLKPDYGIVAAHLASVYGRSALNIMSGENTSENMKLAQAGLTKALTLRPAEELFYTNMGSSYYFRGDFDNAISWFLTGKRLRPDHARIYYNLGHAYRYKGDKQKAIEAYTKYVQMGEKGEEARVEKAKEFIKELSKK